MNRKPLLPDAALGNLIKSVITSGFSLAYWRIHARPTMTSERLCAQSCRNMRVLFISGSARPIGRRWVETRPRPLTGTLPADGSRSDASSMTVEKRAARGTEPPSNTRIGGCRMLDG
jgi:hypothetical protein